MKKLNFKTLQTTLIVAGLIIINSFSTIVIAEEKKDGDSLRAAVQNPISSLISLPFKFTFDFGAKNGDGTILSIQPVYPVTKGN